MQEMLYLYLITSIAYSLPSNLDVDNYGEMMCGYEHNIRMNDAVIQRLNCENIRLQVERNETAQDYAMEIEKLMVDHDNQVRITTAQERRLHTQG